MEDQMPSQIETERDIINTILNSEKVEGIPLIWIQTKLALLLSGIPPEDIFLRQQSLNRERQTKVSHAEIALRINQLRMEGHKILKAKEIVSEEFATSFSNADLAWKKHGTFCRKELPRESD
jgi:hypothetical protein